jgi:error-prone DNA polymerase
VYIELHAHSYYSLLDGVPSPEELVQRAAELNLPALALTDTTGHGAPRFKSAQQAGVTSPRADALNGGGCLTLLAENDAALTCVFDTLARATSKGSPLCPGAAGDHTRGLVRLSAADAARSPARFMAIRREVRAERFASFGRPSFY